jgi:hypothetical protein
MAGYIPGYLYSYNITSSIPSGTSEAYVTLVNGISVVVTNGVTGGPGPYTSAGPNGGLYPGTWWYPGDASLYGGVNGNDVNNALRNEISAAYNKYFNRFAGPVAMENWVWTWLFGGGSGIYGTVDEMIRLGGISSGETAFVASTPYEIPYTYYAPQRGCTDPSASNYQSPAPLYQRLFTSPVILSGGTCTYPPPPPPPPIRPYVKSNGVWTESKNVYIKDAGSWKLCTSAYIKDGGVWKPFLQF